MLVSFWVHGRGKDEPEPMGWVKAAWHGIEENLRWAGGMIGLSEPYEPGQVESAISAKKVAENPPSTEGGGGGWFSGLRGAMSSSSKRGSDNRRGLPPPGTYKIGEVKAEYVKVSDTFTRSLICSSPSRMRRDDTSFSR